MIGKIYFVTNNNIKFSNTQIALMRYGIVVEHICMDVPEIQSTDVREIAEFSARYVGEKLNKPVIKVDVAFEIRALNGFPGPFVKYINQWLSPENMLRIMEDETDRHAKFVDCVSLYLPDNQKCVNFVSITTGTIFDQKSGENGWGIDKIFIPDGKCKTLASYADEEKIEIWNQTHWHQLGLFLNEN